MNKNKLKFAMCIMFCCIILLTMLCALILNFISYFEYDYIYNSSLSVMSLKENETSNVSLLSGKKTSTNSPTDKAIYISDDGKVETTDDSSNNVIAMDLSRNPADGEILLTNETGYNPDVNSLLTADYPIEQSESTFIKLGTAQKEEPLVLILHTHGTEAYYPLSRSTSKTENIVAIGSLMADILNARGVSTIHCDIMHDEESYLNSYNRSKETILKYLEEYPSIQYIFDVHRDAVVDAEGETIKAVTTIDGTGVAQVMFVVGSDYKGGDHPNWQDNLNIAVKLQNLLNSEYKNLARPINIRNATFNAQYATGSLLLEIGTSGNTLTEAKRAAIITANKIADLILGSE